MKPWTSPGGFAAVRRHLAIAAAASCACAGIAQMPAPPVACGMSLAFRQSDADAPHGSTEVWSDASGSALLFVEKLNINTDGTRRSYSVDDFWGQATALNNLCNAMTDACAGLDSTQLRARRVLTQQAAAAGWPADLLAQTRISPSIIPFKNGKPCPAVDGFLVSATALSRPGHPDVCDLGRYVDALVTPAIVVPRGSNGFSQRNVRIGDLVVAALPRQQLAPVFAVVGDTGPAGKLGEASVALNGRLLGRTAEPANYQEIRGRAPYQGQGWSAPPTAVLIFPGSRNAADPYMTPERIDEAAARRFADWGGAARLAACLQR